MVVALPVAFGHSLVMDPLLALVICIAVTTLLLLGSVAWDGDL